MCDVNLGYLQIQLHFFYQSGSRLEIFVRNKKQDIDLCKNVWKTHFWGRFLLLSTPDSRDPVWNMMDLSKNTTFLVQRGTTNLGLCFVSLLAPQLASRWSTLAVPKRWAGSLGCSFHKKWFWKFENCLQKLIRNSNPVLLHRTCPNAIQWIQ